MCGILFSNIQDLEEKKFKKALNLMNHRGPNFNNFLNLNGIYMGHNRLSIIDLNPRSNQPFSAHGLKLIFNGEIYNYKELIKEHDLKVATKSDTEVILLMYKKFGHKCLKYFNGMFAIVILNENNGDIFVARDRLGIKPLYFQEINNEWIFSSEIGAILEIRNSDLDDFGIRLYRKLRMAIKGYTLYKNIKMFPPGHFFLNGELKKYWDLEIHSDSPPEDEELKWLIEDSVKLRKRSDVAVGSFLSGGLDSTILSYILSPNHTWTVGFKESNEFYWSELANSGIKSIHHKTLVDYKSFLQTAKWMINKRRETLSVPNEVLIYLMTKNVKKKNTVVLSGEGADELFWGYDRIFNWAHNSKNLNLNEFDKKYCYGSHFDNEVLDFALENIPGEQLIDKIAYFFQIFHLQGLLRRLDNSTMLCSVEARVPFVDHRLVELLAGMPYSWRMGREIKEPLKRIFSKKIPKQIINRKKVGFPVPLDSIFKVEKNENTTPMDHWINFNLETLQQL